MKGAWAVTLLLGLAATGCDDGSTSSLDAGSLDTGSPDAGSPDAGSPDAGGDDGRCGDGVLGPWEHCDDGALSDDGECATDCTPAAPFHAYDRAVRDFMDRWGIPGGAVALSRQGRIVLVRGYGLADVDADEVVARRALFRLASLSKPVTAVAVLRLVEEGLVDLDAPAFDYLDRLPPLDGAGEDPRLVNVTVRHLLLHAGGWDIAERGHDPMFINQEVAAAFGEPGPADADMIVRYVRGQPLDFDPGERYAYSNFGYCVLGRVIEAVTGEPYESWVQREVLAPMGIEGTMRIGGTRLVDRFEGEVRYYGAGFAPSVYPEEGTAPVPYGGFYVESLDAHGGWIASTIDLTRFLLATDGREGVPDLLRPETTALMTERPDLSTWADSAAYYGFGWLVRPVGDDGHWWHGGSLPGTTTTIVRTAEGFTWAALFNSRDDSDLEGLHADLDATMWEALDTVTAWPDYDLMGAY